MNMKTISTIKELIELEEAFKYLELKNNSNDPGNPKYGEEFILWRGAKNASYDLMSQLQVKLKEKYPSDWKNKIKEIENKLLNKFLSEITSVRLKFYFFTLTLTLSHQRRGIYRREVVPLPSWER